MDGTQNSLTLDLRRWRCSQVMALAVCCLVNHFLWSSPSARGSHGTTPSSSSARLALTGPCCHTHCLCETAPISPPSTSHRTYKLPCQGTGVLPPLSLSPNAISFCPTAVGDRSHAVVTLSNPRLGRLHSAVIRRAVLPPGPKAFEFLLPPDCAFSVSPRVGVVQLGEVRAGLPAVE